MQCLQCGLGRQGYSEDTETDWQMHGQFYDLVPPRTPSRTLVAGAVKRKESTDLSIFKFKLHVLQWHSHYDKTLKRKKDVSIKILEISWQSVV